MFIQEIKKTEFKKCDILLLELRNRTMKYSYRVQENRYGEEWDWQDCDTLSEAQVAYEETCTAMKLLDTADDIKAEEDKALAEKNKDDIESYAKATKKVASQPSPLAPVGNAINKSFNKGIKAIKGKFKEVFYEEVQSVKPQLTEAEIAQEFENLKAECKAVK